MQSFFCGAGQSRGHICVSTTVLLLLLLLLLPPPLTTTAVCSREVTVQVLCGEDAAMAAARAATTRPFGFKKIRLESAGFCGLGLRVFS